MIRLLHTADIHLDAPLRSLALRDPDLRDRVETATRAAFARIVEAAIDTPVDGVLIAGDLFDGAQRSARTAAFLVTQLDRLNAYGIPVFYIKGNHDAENPITGEIDLPANVHVFDGRGGSVQLGDHPVWIHGVSFSRPQAPDSLLPKFGAPVPDATNIAMLHTSLGGAPGHDPYAPCALADLVATGFDYWALGHIHVRRVHHENPWVVMPGIPQGRDIGENGPKSATMIEIEGGAIRISEIPTSTVEFRQLDIAAGACANTDGLRAALRDGLAELAGALTSDTAILRLALAGPFAERWQVERDRDTWVELADDAARATGRIWVEKLSLDLTDPAADDSTSRTGAAAELDSLMRDIIAEPGFATMIDEAVADIMAALPPDARAALAPDAGAARAFGQDMAREGAQHIAARLRGAES